MSKENKSEGLGDSISKFTTATGIKSIVNWISGDDCNCDARQEKLNSKFRYKKNPPKCLNEDEFKWLQNYFENPKQFSHIVIKSKVGSIWARVFGMHYKKICDCNGGRQLGRYINELKEVFESYD
tara:strand:- start:1051 stop:1425 length:375 start_codon:yes stop_codon:yes gene_type:complete